MRNNLLDLAVLQTGMNTISTRDSGHSASIENCAGRGITLSIRAALAMYILGLPIVTGS